MTSITANLRLAAIIFHMTFSEPRSNAENLVHGHLSETVQVLNSGQRPASLLEVTVHASGSPGLRR